MNTQKARFQKSLMAVAITSGVMGGFGAPAWAQGGADDQVLEEVVVRGIRSSLASSINTKRDANTVVDAITAEDIGKLPDVTISDSLQRISGVQIRRSAGEGSTVNIRGLPQVVTQLNGEQFLGSSSVVSTQPDFNEIPSQLFQGADVYKSSTANINRAGITGTVNLKTYRPFDFDQGLTASGSVEMASGEITGETDPMVSGLINWQNERVGFLLSAAYANVNLANSYAGLNAGGPTAGDLAGWTGRSNDAAVMDNFANDDLATMPGADLSDRGRSYLGMQGISAWDQVTERERLGLNGSFQADLGEGWTLTSDWFYSNKEEYNRKVGVSATNKWQGDNWFSPSTSRDTGVDLDGYDFHSWQVAELSPKRLESFTQNDVYDNTSRNVNVELAYDNGGPFTGKFRAISGQSEMKKRMGYSDADLTNGASTLGRTENFVPESYCDGETAVGDEGGCFQAINPNGYSENPYLTYDTRGSSPTWSGFDRPLAGDNSEADTIADYMGDVDSYNIGAYSSENNEDAKGELDAVNLSGRYELEDGFFSSVEGGLRFSNRTADFSRWNLLAPANEGTDCHVQWHATDVALSEDSCPAGETVDGEFQPYIAQPSTPLNANNNVIRVDDFGSAEGIPPIWAVDPADYDKPVEFMESVFGEGERAEIPGSSFFAEMEEMSYFLQGNFEHDRWSGNLGVKVIETDLKVKQNISGGGIAYSNLGEDAGDVFSRRDYTDVLPSLNVSYNLTDDMKLRFAYSQNMVPLDLNQYGDGLVLNYTLDSNDGSPTEGDFIVSGGSLNGNPDLDPWRSENFDLSWEWYLGDTSMVNVGLFYVDIESFTEDSTEEMEQPDADGVVRRSVPISTTGQGDGGTLEGVELGAKLAFGDFVGGPLADFGIDTNYTHSPSEGEGTDVQGDTNPFPDNSEHQFNLALWYENDRFQARVAHNYRSERLAATGAGWGDLNIYQEGTNYIDVSATYDVTDSLSVYFNGSNVTGEIEEYYVDFDDQLAFQSEFEPRYSLGVRYRY